MQTVDERLLLLFHQLPINFLQLLHFLLKLRHHLLVFDVQLLQLPLLFAPELVLSGLPDVDSNQGVIMGTSISYQIVVGEHQDLYLLLVLKDHSLSIGGLACRPMQLL